MKPIARILPALSLLAAGLGGAVVTAAPAQAMDDVSCLTWETIYIGSHEEPGYDGPIDDFVTLCTSWHWAGSDPKAPTEPPNDNGGGSGPGLDPPTIEDASCDELNEWADKLQDRLVSDRKQAIIGEGVVARDKSLRDDAAADLQKARDEAVAVLDAEQAALSDYLEVAPLYDAMREVKPGVWVIVHSQIAKGVDASLPEGRALLDAMDASKVALEIEREAQNDFDEAAHTYADVTSALDGLYDEIDGLERQLRDIGKATEACKTMP